MAAVKSHAAKIREEVESRKSEVRKQLGPLEAELVELLSLVPDAKPEAETHQEPEVPAPGAEAPVPPATVKSPVAKRSRKGGTRAEQAVAMIAASPGIGVPEIAKAMKIKENYLYRVLGKAEKEGFVRKDGRAYYPVAA